MPSFSDVWFWLGVRCGFPLIWTNHGLSLWKNYKICFLTLSMLYRVTAGKISFGMLYGVVILPFQRLFCTCPYALSKLLVLFSKKSRVGVGLALLLPSAETQFWRLWDTNCCLIILMLSQTDDFHCCYVYAFLFIYLFLDFSFFVLALIIFYSQK